MKRNRNNKLSLSLTFPLMLALTLSLSFISCSNEDFLTTSSDETRVVSFSIGTDMEKLTSKASTEYRSWESGDPASFGAYGLYDRNMTSKIFDNQEVDRVGDSWEYSPLKYWADYDSFNAFDFFGYMPYVAGASLTQGGEGHESEYTLSFQPAAIANSVLADVADVPLICKEPVHKTKIGEVINYQMDQTLTGFSLKFRLGDKMSNIRDFVIKDVKIKGAAETLPVGGTVSRTYTYNSVAGTWTAGSITWSDITTNPAAINYTVPFVDYDDEGTIYDGTNETLRIGYSDPGKAQQWGTNFYAIPSAEFAPTIEVTYDVTVQDEEDNYITTRENITSTIQFSSSYFESYTSGGAIGQLNTIEVLIEPEYLYVLADADQRYGYIVVAD